MAIHIGFLRAGWPGLLAAGTGFVLPAMLIVLSLAWVYGEYGSTIFVAFSNSLIPRIRNSAWAGSLLDGVTVSSLGLMAVVTWQLGRASLVDPLTVLVALVAFVLLVWYRVNSTWLIAAGGLIGVLSLGLS